MIGASTQGDFQPSRHLTKYIDRSQPSSVQECSKLSWSFTYPPLPSGRQPEADVFKYGTNIYRLGDLNLPARMNNILGMDPRPDFVQFITFNDGPEAHYIGNLWPEAGADDASSSYANMDQWSHDGWRPLVKSFNEAFASAATAGEMKTPGDGIAIGAAWFKTILVDSVDCDNDTKPDGFDQGTNALHWAVVLDPKADAGYTLTVAGDKTQSVPLNPGLNYGSSEGGLQAGAQTIELHDPSGKIVMTATGGMCVSTECPSGVYNSNYQVVELTDGSQPANCQEW